jgi:hypothetical protein
LSLSIFAQKQQHLYDSNGCIEENSLLVLIGSECSSLRLLEQWLIKIDSQEAQGGIICLDGVYCGLL